MSENNKQQQNKPKNKKKNKRVKKGGNMIDVEPIAGTRDFLPPEMRLRNWLFKKFENVSTIFGFEPYDCPVLEPVELYKRKAGEDIVKQMYNFTEKSGLEVSLRPEMTPSLARIILKQGAKLLLPVKYYSLPQCWRYETTTRGRKREHFQWNMDIWGVNGIGAESELLSAVHTFFTSVGLTSKEIGIKVSSRKIIQTILEHFKISDEDFAKVCVVIDKLDKIGEEEVKKQLINDIGLSDEVSDDILEIIQTDSSLEDFDKTLQKILKISKTHESILELKNLFELAEAYGFKDWLIFDPTVIRGLSYYTGIVFEAFTKVGELKRAICGGGRYDKILKTYGSKKIIPACGFGFGDIVILEVLKDLKKIPTQITAHKVDDIVIPFNEKLRPEACKIVKFLRENGRKADIIMKKTKVNKAFNYADRVGADRAIFIAPDELEKKCVRIKYLREGKVIKKDNKVVNEEVKNSNEFTVPIEKLLTFKKPE